MKRLARSLLLSFGPAHATTRHTLRRNLYTHTYIYMHIEIYMNTFLLLNVAFGVTSLIGSGGATQVHQGDPEVGPEMIPSAFFLRSPGLGCS